MGKPFALAFVALFGAATLLLSTLVAWTTAPLYLGAELACGA